ncbi:MAG: fimbiral protein pilA [Polyangiaceae bacterium]
MQPGSSPYARPPAPAKKTPVWIIVLVVVGVGAVLLIGTLGALAVFGTRRYLAAAKTAEAKSTIGAIARAARASYERESLEEGQEGAHALCKSAVSVPAAPPMGVRYQPALSGGDFDTGDAQTGWKCLRVAMTQPMYYQYNYHQGAGYLAPAAGAGPDGFEAAAVGDLDGDGDTSLFATSGNVTGTTVTLRTTLYTERENE